MFKHILWIALSLCLPIWAAEPDADLEEVARLSQQWELGQAEKNSSGMEEAARKTADEVLAEEIQPATIPQADVAQNAQAVANVNANEAEIPVLTKLAPTTASKGSLTRLGFSLAVILIMAGGLLLFGKYWAKRRGGLKPHTQIKVLTQFALGPKKSLAIIRVAGESILIGITDHNINMIKPLALLDEELPEDIPQKFDEELDQAQEDFSFGNVRDKVNMRLRDMRSI